MAIPNLPTDNLYKFMALSGVAIFLVSTIYISNYIVEIDTTIKEIRAESNIYNKELAFMEEDINVIKNKVDSIKLEENYDTKTTANKLNSIKDKQRELILNKERLYEKIAKINAKNNNLILLSIIWSVITVISIFMMVYGFHYWYDRVQKYMDIKLKKEAESDY